MKKNKILFLIYDKNFGGCSRHVYNLCTNLNCNEFKPILVSISSPIHNKIKDKIKSYSLEMKSKTDLAIVNKIKKIVSKEKPNIIHLHSTRAGILGTYILKDTKIPIIYTEHLFTQNYIPLNKYIFQIQLFLFKYLSNHISHTIAVSNSVKKFFLEKRIFPKNKISVIYNGTCTNKLKHNIFNQNDLINLGSVGSLTNIKNYEYLLKSIKIIKKYHQNFHLEIVGNGPCEKKLKNISNKSNLNDYVTFTPFTDNIYEKINKWDIYIQPSISESFGLSIAEAMSMKIPIIATKTGGIPELVNKKSGILVDLKNPNQLADSIIKLMNDLNLRKNMGQHAHETIEKNFTIKQMVNKTKKLYRSFLSINYFLVIFKIYILSNHLFEI